MELSQRLEQILGELRPVFSREATFGWFVLLVWGILLNTQPAAVTSYDGREEVDPEKPHLIMLCPDGSGFVQKSILEEGYLDLTEVCTSCNASLHEHQSYIVIGGGIPVTK